MLFFIDTEFIESGPHEPIDLISIGIVSGAGCSLYLVSNEFYPSNANDWVKENVLKELDQSITFSLSEIANQIKEFIGVEKPEFWGYYADYDWVVFCQIFGSMINLPKGWPMYCRDIKQLCSDLGNPPLPPQKSTEHNALNDALWNKLAYEFLITRGA